MFIALRRHQFLTMDRLVCLRFVFFVSLMYLIVTAKGAFSKVLVQKKDVIITDDNGSIKCDQIICPTNTFLCHVLKQTDPLNADVIRRTDTCYSKDGTMLFQSQKKTMAKSKEHTYLDLSADRDGLIITNEEISKGFHFSTQNIAALKGKKPAYIKGIANTVAETRAVVTKRLASLWHNAF